MMGQIEVLLAPIQARIQGEVGEFLLARQALQTALRQARSADELAEVQRLTQDQAALEAEMGEVLPPIQRKEFTFGTLAGAAGFLARMEAHLSRVNDLKRRLRAAPGAAGGAFSWGTVALVGGGLAVGLLVFSQMRRRR